MILPTQSLGISTIYSRTGRYGARWDWDIAKKAHVLRLVDIETGAERDVALDSTGIHSQPVWLSSP